MFEVKILPYRPLADFPLSLEISNTLLGVSVDIFWNHTSRQQIKPSVVTLVRVIRVLCKTFCLKVTFATKDCQGGLFLYI